MIEVFYGPFLDRLKSIMKIQTWFRYIIWRKQQNPLFKRRKNGKIFLANSLLNRPLSLDFTLNVDFIRLKRIVTRIQKSWRRNRLTRRINTLINIANYVATINSNKLYLEQSLYSHLEETFK